MSCAFTACSTVARAPEISLTDQHGQPWALSAQRGTAFAVYFGFTHCADTCPATLAKLSSTLAATPNAKVLFITVDPERDTPNVLDAYVRRFSGAPIIALTGSRKQIDAVESAYHMWSQKIPGKRGKGDYDEAHTSYIVLIDRNGVQRDLLHDDASVTKIAQAFAKVLQ